MGFNQVSHKGLMRFLLSTILLAPGWSHGLSQGSVLVDVENPTLQIAEYFGESTAATAQGHLLVGAPGYEAAGVHVGRAYLLDGTTGSVLMTLENPTPEPDDYFGFAVAVTPGGDFLVSARSDDTGAINAGSVYLFDGQTGAVLLTINNPTPGLADLFGWSVAATPDGRLIVSAAWDDTSYTSSGTVYIFDSTTGALLHTIDNPTPGYNDQFGYKVLATPSGDIVISALLDSSTASESGAVYVFDGTTYGLKLNLFNPSATTYGYFGYDLAVTPGGDILVGHFNHASTIGEVHLFDGVTGDLLLTLLDPSLGIQTGFGASVAVAPNGELFVGAFSHGYPQGALGQGRLYRFHGDTGALLGVLENPRPNDEAYFAYDLAVTPQGNVLASARDWAVYPRRTGWVYLVAGNFGASVTAAFSASPTSGQAPLNVQFTDGSTAIDTTISSWAWDFDNDGVVDSTQQNPSHVYGSPGTYSVGLTVSDGLISHSLVKQNLIVVSPLSTARWPFDEGSGCVANDLDGLAPGDLGPSCSGGNGPVWTQGVVNGALQFDGVDDVVTVPAHPSLTPVNITLAAWVWPVVLGNYDTIFMHTSRNSWVDGYGLTRISANTISFFVNNYTNTVTAPLPTSVWSHVAATYDGTTMKLYINGVLEASLPYATPINYPSPSATPLLIGKGKGSATAYGWNGMIDEAILWDYAAQASEISALYQRDAPISPDGFTFTLDAVSPCEVVDEDFLHVGELGPYCAGGNAPSWASGYINGALEFDGVDDVVSFPDHPDLRPEQLTIAAWIKPDTLSTWDSVFMKTSSAGWSDGYGLVHEGNNHMALFINNYANSVSAPIQTQVWTHVAATYDGQDMKIYINGALEASTPYTEPIDYPNPEITPLLLGNGKSATLSRTWDGLIDQVHFLRYAASAAEIGAIYDAEFVAPVEVAITLGFNESSGCVAANATGTNHGQLGPSCSGGNGPAWVAGKIGNALHFDGSDDWVQVMPDPDPSPYELTLAAWVKPDQLGNYDTVFMHASSGSWSDGFGVYYTTNGGIQFYINQYSNAVSAPLSAGVWTHVAASYDGADMKLYINGQLASSQPYTLAINHAPATQPLSIGKGMGGATAYGWDGLIDEARVFSHALTAAEIHALYLE